MQKRPCKMYSCTMQTCGYQLDPLKVSCTIPAGEACEKCLDATEDAMARAAGEAEEENCLLATAFIADQRYKAGYCFAEALNQGTYFPELVRPYMK